MIIHKNYNNTDDHNNDTKHDNMNSNNTYDCCVELTNTY